MLARQWWAGAPRERRLFRSTGANPQTFLVCGAVDQKGCREMTILVIRVNVAAIVWALVYLAVALLT